MREDEIPAIIEPVYLKAGGYAGHSFHEQHADARSLIFRCRRSFIPSASWKKAMR